ncbi:short-chain dehydrogenase [Saitoella complicata NRRL Y-17804]|uniref:NAD(P)-binding protein n=1 Tax=Saitoella complicata (strain BCRC 22490 / CBS 7301 / JCM 7358 / NBRC 10748 / NRRL Y-17804) TaxID=698492 RepID=A0A0E9N8C3_SAICN|nr:short-chain dehydrogenase [Saitoella complicata NRRL Y-17804]ODQ55742.1 short-chain dehydrogenase [Saitoella complicata NRRL Y-17804]GAO46157.1 hypothetical protein G7K_0395-t1 [Saitoella complicata NRRL Y-17804]
MSSPVIIVTGASRGIGLEVCKTLLTEFSSKIVAVSRSTPAGLTSLKEQYSDSIEIVTGDVASPETSKNAVNKAIEKWGQLDGLVLNAGTLDPVARLEDADVDAWRKGYDINFFGLLPAIKESIPHLRKSKGRVVFVSSGAATSAYEGWGCYGSTKAAMNHLNETLAFEEPEITAVSIRPGVVDTEMQRAIREEHRTKMGEGHSKFIQLHENGDLVPAEKPAGVCARLAVKATKDLSGLFLSWNSPEVKAYQG